MNTSTERKAERYTQQAMRCYGMRLETKTGELVVHLDIRPDGTSTRTDADDTVEYSKSMTRKAIREMQAILRMGDEYEVITYTNEVAR